MSDLIGEALNQTISEVQEGSKHEYQRERGRESAILGKKVREKAILGKRKKAIHKQRKKRECKR